MDISDMRYDIARAYPGPGWKKKVAAMPDDQVIAVYYRIITGKSAGVREKKKSKTTNNLSSNKSKIKEKTYSRKQYEHEEDCPKQITFADIM